MAQNLYIGVGCGEAQWLPFAVLKYSIERHASRPVRVEPLFQSGIEIPIPHDLRNRQKTPFSFQRFVIPEVRDFQGRAIYLDSDMLVFDDISILFDLDFGVGNVLAVPSETSVMLLDCERLNWRISQLVSDLDSGRLSYDVLMSCRSIADVRYSLPSTWNWLDNSGKTPPPNLALLHYTVTSNQPWISSAHPLGHLWLKSLFEAIENGALHRSDVEAAVQGGFVRPSLLYQVENRVVRKDELPADIVREDLPFVEYCRSVHFAIVDGFPR